MQFIYPLIIGFAASVFGFIAPTMLSMTAVRTSMEKGKTAGIQFVAGASSVVFVQVLIAVFFASYLIANPDIILTLKKAAIFILLGLAVFFFFEGRKEFKVRGKEKSGKSYIMGLTMALLNQLAIPFYLVMVTLVEVRGWIEFNNINSVLFATGAVLGAFSIFSTYVIFCEIISVKYKFIAKNINYILSVVFLFLSSLTVIQLFS